MEDNNEFICLKCNKNFIKRKKDFQIHIQQCVGNKCVYCNKEFSSKQYLERHMTNCKLKKKRENQNITSKINVLEIELNEKNKIIENLELQLKTKDRTLLKIKEDYETLKQSYNESQQLVNKLQSNLSNANTELTNANKEINDLKIIEKMNLQRIEDLKDTKPTIIYNTNTTNNNTNQFANNINNATLIQSPETIIESIDTKSLFQSNIFKNEEKYF